MSEDQAQPELTYGGKAVGLTFNPGGNAQVDDIKKQAANLIDEIAGPSGENLLSVNPAVDGEKIAMRKLAIRSVQEGQMWAVKAVTWQY